MRYSYLITAILLIPPFALNSRAAFEPEDPVEMEDVEEMVDDNLPESVDSVTLGPSDDEMRRVEREIIGRYSKPWDQISMQGRLQFEGLPIRPSVKLYMNRGESVIISARAPIFGEVARIELGQNFLTIINKHSKKYCTFDLSNYARTYPGMISDFQDLLLGDIVYPGHGKMTPELSSECHWSYEDGDIFILPEKELQWSNMGYGFMVDPSTSMMKDLVLFFRSTDIELDFNYLYGLEGWTFGLSGVLKGRPLEGALQLSYPDYFPMALEFTDTANRYTQTDLKEVLKF